MNIIDLVILSILALGAFRGFLNGIIIELATLLGFLMGVYCAINYTDMAVLALPDWDISKNILQIICFILIFISITAAMFGIGKLLEKFVSVVMLGVFNKILGIFFGVAKTAFILSAIIVLLNVFDEAPNFIPKQAKDESTLYKPLSLLTPSLFPVIENTVASLDKKSRNETP